MAFPQEQHVCWVSSIPFNGSWDLWTHSFFNNLLMDEHLGFPRFLLLQKVATVNKNAGRNLGLH
jgi:hypothetical protein